MRAIEEHLKLLSVFVRVHLSDLNTVALVVVSIFSIKCSKTEGPSKTLHFSPYMLGVVPCR